MRLFVSFLLVVFTSSSAMFAQKPSLADLPDLSRASADVLRNLPPIRLLDKGNSQPVLDAQHLAENVMVIQAKRKVGAQLTALDSSLRPFYHGVASGDPLSDRVILWTRVTPTVDAPVTVRWYVATDTAMSTIVTSGTFTTSQSRDYTVKVDARGLEADKTYYYMFTALGANSLIGRTKTLPAPGATVRQVRFAVVSCSSYPHGFFSAYGRIAARNDLDAVLHLGDYIYEYNASETSYGGRTGQQIGRVSNPLNEIISLADYRTRYSQYRLDEDLRRVHQQHPMIHVWDDHETTNDSYKDGAENHQSATEGRWDVRKAIGKRVAYEWLPTRENADTIIYRRFAFGTLVDLLMLDTRLEGREAQVVGVLPSSPQASKDSISNPNRTMLGAKQFAWLTENLRTSRSSWRVLGNQVMFAPLVVDRVDMDRVRRYSFVLSLLAPTLMTTLQEAFYGDVWTNYPAERKKLMDSISANSIRNVVITTGDFHTAFSMDVTLDAANTTRYNPSTGQGAVAVEFMCPSISSGNFDENVSGGLFNVINGIMRTLGFPSPQREGFADIMAAKDTQELLGVLNDALREQNRHLKNINLTDHGYTLLDITPERAQGDYWYMDTILVPSVQERFGGGFFTLSGQNNLTRSNTPAPPKPIQALPAPARLLLTTLVAELQETVPQTGAKRSQSNTPPASTGAMLLLGFYPNPMNSVGYINYALEAALPVTVKIYDAVGKVISTLVQGQVQQGNIVLMLDASRLPSGAYTCSIETPQSTIRRALVVQH